MVSVVENQTLSRRLQHYVEEEKENGENLDSHEPCQKILDQKSIAAVQICFRCGRKFPFKKGRKRCPNYQSILRTNIILKASQF